MRDHSTIQIDADGELGAVTGGLTLGDSAGAGRLRALDYFDLDASRPITIGAAGGDIDTNGYDVGVFHGIAGPGELHKDGSGQLGLFGLNTFNGLDITNGEVQLGDIGLPTSLVGDVSVNSAYLYIYNADLSQVGTIRNSAGVTVFDLSSSAGGTSIENTNGGVIYFDDQSTAGSAVIVNHDFSGMLFYDHSSAGSASITANDGEIYFFGQSTAGAATIAVNSNSRATFHDFADGGTARLIVNGSGYIDFSDDLGPDGDGRITVGSIEGDGEVDIGVDNVLRVGGNGLSTTFSGIIYDSCGCTPGSGNLEKTGSGVLTLSGLNEYTGATVLSGGALIVNGSIAASSGLTAGPGTIIGGVGQLPTTVLDGALLAPGNSIGTITVNGDLSFNSTSAYAVQVSPTSSDLVDVTGVASLSGKVFASVYGSGFSLGSGAVPLHHPARRRRPQRRVLQPGRRQRPRPLWREPLLRRPERLPDPGRAEDRHLQVVLHLRRSGRAA